MTEPQPATYSEAIVLERLRALDGWWYTMEEFARTTGFSLYSTRLMLDRLCRVQLADKLIDRHGEGYYLHYEEGECQN